MSSHLTETELLKVKSASKEDRRIRAKLVRSSSFERLKQFNTFICSKNYFILPIILTSLRTSNTIVQSSLERCISCTKFFIGHTTVKYCSGCLKAALTLLLQVHLKVKSKIVMLGLIVHKSVQTAWIYVQNSFLKTIVYGGILIIFLQLIYLIHVLTSVIIPAGLVFMLTCLYLITHVNLLCLHYFLQQMDKEKVDKVKMPRLSRRDILGKRTISNFNFF